jgi:hypothetical protein
MSLRSRVDHVVDGLQTASHFWSASRAPLDNGGGYPVPSLLNRSLEEIKDIVDEGPPFSISDLVGGGFLLRVACGLSPHHQPAYIDAVANFGGTIDDRKFLVGYHSSF